MANVGWAKFTRPRVTAFGNNFWTTTLFPSNFLSIFLWYKHKIHSKKVQCNHFSAFPKSSRVRPPYWIHGRCLVIASRAKTFERRLANGLFCSELSKLITIPNCSEKIWILPPGVEPMTFQVLIECFNHWAMGDFMVSEVTQLRCDKCKRDNGVTTCWNALKEEMLK